MRQIIIFISVLLPITAFAQSSEDKVKVVFLEKFTRFVEWPEESAISDTSKAFVLGVVGENPFGSLLEQAYATRKIKNKEVEICYVSNLNEISECHLLFIPKSKEKELSKILPLTKNKPILTIGDTKGFAERGVMINFYLSGNKIRFEINESAVRESGLSMSFLLLKIAKTVNN